MIADVLHRAIRRILRPTDYREAVKAWVRDHDSVTDARRRGDTRGRHEAEQRVRKSATALLRLETGR